MNPSQKPVTNCDNAATAERIHELVAMLRTEAAIHRPNWSVTAGRLDESAAALATQHTENQRLKEELAWQEASLVNLHCALQSTAHMDPADSRIPVITGEVVRDLQVMAKRIRAVVDVESAESELARLRSVNEALVGALEDILNKYEATKRIGKFSTRLESTLAIKRWGRAQGNARELIAKHRAALAQAKEAM